MKAILQNSLLARALFRLREWYHEGAIAGFFGKIRAAYPYSRFRRVWEGFCSAPSCTAANSGYARLLAALRRVVERLGDAAAQSLVYRLCLASGIRSRGRLRAALWERRSALSACAACC